MTDQFATKISEIMNTRIETVGASATVKDIAIKMKEEKVSSVVVLDNNTSDPLGIITERDLVTKVCINDIDNTQKILAEQLMSSPLITISQESSPSDAAELMIQNRVRHLLVISTESNEDEKKLSNNDRISIKPMGIITPLDFERAKVLSTSDYDKDSSIGRILDHYRNDFDFFS